MKNLLMLIVLFPTFFTSFGQIKPLGPFPKQLRTCSCGNEENTKYEMFLFHMKGNPKYSQGALIKCPGECEDRIYFLRGDVENGTWIKISPAIDSFESEDITVIAHEYGMFLYLFSGKKYYRYDYKDNSFAQKNKDAYMRDCRNELCRE